MKTTIFIFSLASMALSVSLANPAQYIETAEQGDAEAQYNLGMRYQNGDGFVKDAVKAVEWFRRAAEQENPMAQNALSVCYIRGEGVDKDIIKAFDWFRKAVSHGKVLNTEVQETIKSFNKAAEQGEAEAQYSLGMCHIYGTYEVPTGLWPWNDASGMSYPNFEKAAELFKKAAEQNHLAAQYQLGISYNNGQGVVKDLIKAFEWYHKSAEQGYAPAQFIIAQHYLHKSDDENAIEWYKKAKGASDAEAQHWVGMRYYFLDGDENKAKAIARLTKASEQGYANASEILGWIYEQGNGVPQDIDEAIQMYTKAAEQGNETTLDRINQLQKMKKKRKNEDTFSRSFWTTTKKSAFGVGH